jgi:hypothetical protein
VPILRHRSILKGFPILSFIRIRNEKDPPLNLSSYSIIKKKKKKKKCIRMKMSRGRISEGDLDQDNAIQVAHVREYLGLYAYVAWILVSTSKSG